MRIPHRPALEDVTSDGDDDSHTYVGLKSDLLIPGRGDPIRHGALVIRDAKIDWVGAYSSLPSKYGAIKFVSVPVLLPGLWDCHVHFSGNGVAFNFPDDHRSLLPGASPLIGAVTVADLQRTLHAGFTSVRELSGVSSSFVSWSRLAM